MDVIGLWLAENTTADLARRLAAQGVAARQVASPADLAGDLDGLVAAAGMLESHAQAVRKFREARAPLPVPVVAVLERDADEAAVTRALDFADEIVRQPVCAVELAARLRLLSRLRQGLVAARRQEALRHAGKARARARATKTGFASDGKVADTGLAPGQDAALMESLGRLTVGIAQEIASPVQYVGGNLEFLANTFARMIESLDGLSVAALRLGQDEGGLAAALAELLDDEELRFLLEETPAAIRESREGLDRVAALLQSLGNFARQDTATPRTVDVVAVLEDVLTLSRGVWKYEADVATDIEPDLPAVVMPPVDLGRALLVLLVRAARAIREKLAGKGGKGRIDVLIRRAGEAVEVVVRDDGARFPIDRSLTLVRAMMGRRRAGFEALAGVDGGITVVLTLPRAHGPAALGA
ncbi:hypothetical protein [Solidesulfovibrio sp.]|uniref:hypothetical protein n=1 Tax=Solidesulfovibrio sp. TaxID=2910990 RepID=UPI002B1ED7A0|nr:hypothetical protein [Solidesulfovibrio sp.]MEA5089546.1 hypothetical protein [Solidesulfovibrio sp.]